jgi:hypothetical protein
MSNEKNIIKKHGGARPGSGPKPNPDGPKKIKKSVSVDKVVWHSAVNLWRREMSPLVEQMLRDYLEKSSSGKQVVAI